ncbi:MAG TPA: AAA family ATPase [Azospirillaceae bacterium]|nr:AAA family ATPase [Azospirillaceae bacterium]HRQ81544.1 AAA family ATPase [Azospirillaceae bacterium]
MSEGRLTKFRVAGFRSIRDATVELTPATILIGPNGVGKSNLLWALEMVRMLAFESLQRFVSERGGAAYLLHYGPRNTIALELELEFNGQGGDNAYEATLAYTEDNNLFFLKERAGYRPLGAAEWTWCDLGAGHRESRLKEKSADDATARTVRWRLRRINFYHFHDTSRRSALRTPSYADTSADYLRSDGSNLPIYLMALMNAQDKGGQAAWRRIEGALRQVAPFIRELKPVEDRTGVRLEWIDDRGETFGPAHLSDGTLRALALISALAQPQDSLPLLSSIDEPELGLHPAGLGVLCGLISSVAARRQVIVSTQSPVVLDHFEPEQVIVVERREAASHFQRLDPAALAGWLEDYSLSELYDKNVLGGRP